MPANYFAEITDPTSATRTRTTGGKATITVAFTDGTEIRISGARAERAEAVVVVFHPIMRRDADGRRDPAQVVRYKVDVRARQDALAAFNEANRLEAGGERRTYGVAETVAPRPAWCFNVEDA